MSKKVAILALTLGLAAAACARPIQANVTFGSGQQFVPQVADFLDDVGLGASIAVASDGTPFVAYYGFTQEVPKGQIPPVRPITAPSLPAVLLTSEKAGIWNRGAVAMQASIPNVNVAFGPAIVPEVKSMTPQNVNGTAIVADASGGLHVVWAADTGLWYAESMAGASFMAKQILKLDPPLTAAGPLGAPSIAMAPGGAPWVAFMRTTAEGQQVTVASRAGLTWKSEVAATIPLRTGVGAQPSRTAIAFSGSGTPVVVYSDGSDVLAATPTGGDGKKAGWTTHVVESGADGIGLSATTSKDGTIHVAYYAGGEIHTAVSKDGTSWPGSTVASVGSGTNDAGRSTGIAIDGSGTVYVTWYDPGTDSIQLASASGSAFNPIQVQGTQGGNLPALAVTADGSAVYVAWHDEVDQNLELGTYANVSGLALAVRSPTPTGVPSVAPPAGQQPCTKPVDGVVSIVAQGLQFDTSCIEVPAGQPFTIHLDNKDAGTPHNIAIYPSSTDVGSPLFKGDLLTGPATTDYKVPALKPGEFYFQCDVHTTMNGKLVVTSGGGGTGGGTGTPSAGGGLTTAVTAQGLAFDTSTITLKAGVKSTITFTNNDASVQHNIAIYASATDTASPLFRGDLVTGPNTVTYAIPPLKPGTYYFQCDIHPTIMNGTVVVK